MTWLVAVFALVLTACDRQPTEVTLAGTDLAAGHTTIDGRQATSINGDGHIREGDWDVQQ